MFWLFLSHNHQDNIDYLNKKLNRLEIWHTEHPAAMDYYLLQRAKLQEKLKEELDEKNSIFILDTSSDLTWKEW